MLFAMLQDNGTPGNEEWSIQEPGFVACSVQSYVFLVLTFWRKICWCAAQLLFILKNLPITASGSRERAPSDVWREINPESPVGHIRESFMTKLTSVSWWCPRKDHKGTFRVSGLQGGALVLNRTEFRDWDNICQLVARCKSTDRKVICRTLFNHYSWFLLWIWSWVHLVFCRWTP